MHGARPLRSTRRLQNLSGTLPKWYTIVRNQAGPTQISIYDEIGFYGVPAAAFLDELSQVAGDIELHLHSPGGDIYEGLAIYNGLLQARKRGNVQVVIDGLAASAASFIAMAASRGMLEISPHARMMIHDGFCMAIGNAADMRELADQLDAESDNIAGIYADRTGKPAAYWREKMAAETWYTDQQAVAEGLADRIHGQEENPADTWDLSVFAHYAGITNVAPVIVNADGSHTPMSGTHSHSHPSYEASGDDATHSHEHSHDGDAAHQHQHAAPPAGKLRNADGPKELGDGWVIDPDGQVRFDPDGDGDDDSTASGDTDHDYWDADGKQIKDIPPRPSVAPDARRSAFPVLNAEVDSSPWDASKAWHNGAASDDPAAFYKGICAGRKAGDPSTQDAWALPYKYHPGDAPNAAGVRAALSRLSSTKGLTNESEARSTLERLMKQINPDYEPDDYLDPALLASAFSVGLEGAAR